MLAAKLETKIIIQFLLQKHVNYTKVALLASLAAKAYETLNSGMMRKKLGYVLICVVFSLCSSLSISSTPLERALNYQFLVPEYLTEALLHPSHPSAISHRSQFERLEFLGDRVLNLIVAEYLYDSCSEQEGPLSERLASLVSTESCLQIAKFIELEKYLKAVNGVKSSKILADGVEALLGAVYRDGGLETCRNIVINSWIPFLERDEPYSSNNLQLAKSNLQKWLQSQEVRRLPIYSAHIKSGSEHEPVFECTVNLGCDKLPIFSGHGSSKKSSEQSAAISAMNWIQSQNKTSF